MDSQTMRDIHAQFRAAITQAQDDTLPAETREAAAKDAAELRLKLDEAIIEDKAAREDEQRLAEVEALAKARDAAAAPQAPAEPSLSQKFDEWHKRGRPGTFSVAVMPDYAHDLRAVGNDRASVVPWDVTKTVGAEGRDVQSFSHIERRTDVLMSDAGTVYSSYLTPARTDRSLSWHENAASGVLKAGPTIIQTPDDSTIYYPTFATDASATHHDEAAQVSETNPVLSRVQLDAYRYDGYFQFSTEMARSGIIDVVGMLQEAANRAIATAVAAALATGSGSGLPQGLSDTNTTTVAGATADSATAYTFDNLITLKNSVLPGWRSNASWVFGSTAYTALCQLKDGQGQYYWRPSNTANEPDRLLGYPVYEDSGFAAMTSAKKGPVLFGDFSQFLVRYAGPVVFEMSDSFAFDYFLTTARFAKWIDSELIQTSAIKHLLMAT